ncbi:hypothetical protein KY326_03840 [Candidatus Woesearchaeota archaeon]|nr:hypothetical protein [Candidatus Woesearchaeota archaeon]
MIKGKTYSTKFGHFLQGKATITPQGIEYKGTFVEKENHLPLVRAVPFSLSILTEHEGFWLQRLQKREWSEANRKAIKIISPTMELLNETEICTKEVRLIMDFSSKRLDLSSSLFFGKLQFVKTKEVGHENNLWFKGSFQNGQMPFELNIYSQPIYQKEN